MTRKIQPAHTAALDHIIPISKAISDLQRVGFKVEEVMSIGKHTFKGFCLWAKQVKCPTPHTERWVDIFSQGWIDYCVIVASK